MRTITTGLLLTQLVLSTALAAPDAPKKKSAPTPAEVEKRVFENPAEAGPDFAVVGEYWGGTLTAQLGAEPAGLQVLALGEGRFQAMQYRGGLPGAGWNGVDKFPLTGQRIAGVVELRAGEYLATIDQGVATLFNAGGQQVGTLYKTQRTSPTLGAAPPCGATILFDGTGTEQFEIGEMTEDGLLTPEALTKLAVGDFYLHVEFRIPYMPYESTQRRGNSGVYIQQRYEMQILDSFGIESKSGDCAAVYRQRPPDVNMSLPPLTWQTYDIDFRAPRWDQAGKKVANARITLWHNGVAVHDDVEVPRKTGVGKPEAPEARPIRLQAHGAPVRFRNIWIMDYGNDNVIGDTGH